jgi:nitric oxide dioxygenase
MPDTKQHADNIVGLFDSLCQLLGPDVDFLCEICHQVGDRHKKMGIEASFFPIMGRGLVFSLEMTLGAKLTDEDREAWVEVYKLISDEIVKAME